MLSLVKSGAMDFDFIYTSNWLLIKCLPTADTADFGEASWAALTTDPSES